MEIDDIEYKIACGDLTAAEVFTQMKQHINAAEQLCKIYFSIASSRIGSDAVRSERDKYIAENISV